MPDTKEGRPEGRTDVVADTLTGRVAVVTGAGTGVGRAVAGALHEMGVVVYLVGRRKETLASAQGIPNPADITSSADVARLAGRISTEQGSLDILVHSAGIFAAGRIVDTTTDDWDELHGTNVRGPFDLTRALLPLMPEGGGDVVFMNSSIVTAAARGVGAYAATKHGLRALADALRAEVNDCGIRVLTVFLGRTATPTQEAIHASEGRTYEPERLLQPEDVARSVMCALSLPRTAEVTDIHIRPALPPRGNPTA